MTILQLGMAKSGNFWIYKVIQEILDFSNIEKKSFVDQLELNKEVASNHLSVENQEKIDVIDIENNKVSYRVSSIIKNEIDNFDDYLSKSTHVWSHSQVKGMTNEVLSKFDKVVYIVRDPRDVFLSTSNFVMTDYMKKFYPNNWKSAEHFRKHNLISNSIGWKRHVSPYLNADFDNMHVLFYERLLINFDDEIKKLLNFLEIELSSKEIKYIKRITSANKMIKKNPNHVNIPQIYKWRKLMTENQTNRFTKYCKEPLIKLNYPFESSEDLDLPKMTNEKIIEKEPIDMSMILEKIGRDLNKKFSF